MAEYHDVLEKIQMSLESIDESLSMMVHLKKVELRIMTNQITTGVRWEDVKGWINNS